MLRRIALTAALLLAPVAAMAQVGGVTSTAAPPVHGFGTLAATNASTLLSTLTANAAGTAWPTVPGEIYVINQTAASIYVCPLGGTCAASGANTGLIISSGSWYGFLNPSSNMTLIAPTAGSVQAQW